MPFRPEGGRFPKQLGFPASFNPSFMPPGFPNFPPHLDTPPWQPSEGHRGLATTVFIGNIEDRCTNTFLERMMKECGHVLSWKRIQGSNGKPQAFGFCEFEEPSGTLRALRMLSSLIVNGKQLVVKAEDKVRTELRKWQLKKAKSEGQKAVDEEDLKEDGELPADEEERKGDEEARKKIFSWIGTDYPEISISVARKIEEEEDESKRNRKERKHIHRHSEREHEKEHRHRPRRRRSPSRSSSRSRRSSSEEASRRRKRTRTNSMSAEEIRELKKLLREKERSYEKRVEAWEEREEQKARHYEKLKKKSKEEKSHLKHEAYKLRRFFENYDDGYDEMYYKGEQMATRLKLRAKEKLEDAKDRLAEEQEIEKAAKKALEEILKTEPANGVTVDDVDLSLKEDAAAGIESNRAEPKNWTATDIEKADEKEEVKKTVVISSGIAPLPKQINNNLSQVFGMDDEEEVDRLRQCKTIVKFEITAEDRRQHMTDHERKEIMRNIIRGIPTSRVILFKHPLDWDQLDEALVDNKIKPWITKKIIAFIGEEDDSLRDFICEKILARTSATDILEDIKMILDEDAGTFVMKLWRLLHYETEAKRMGVST